MGQGDVCLEETFVFMESMPMLSSGDFGDELLVQIESLLRSRSDDVAAAHGGMV